VVDVAHDFTNVKKGLRWDASPVEADSADLVAIDANDFLSELSEPDCGVISARARADYNGVNLMFSQRGCSYRVVLPR
jgi:hypothetical protein